MVDPKNKMNEDYPAVLLAGWQELLQAIATRFEVPCSLVMRSIGDELEVYLSNDHPDNPYELHAREKLSDGPYCEVAMRSDDYFMVNDANRDPKWKCCHDAANLGMISYLGFPLRSPGGKLFGTICVLDHKVNDFNKNFVDVLRTIKTLIEIDMEKYEIHQQMVAQQEKKIEAKEIALQEVLNISNKMNEDLLKRVSLNIENMILPIIGDLKRCCAPGSTVCHKNLEVLENLLAEIDSDFSRQLLKAEKPLTITETKICNLIRQGMLHKDIAALLTISENTVKNHAKNIKAKLGIADSGLSLKEFFGRP